MIHNFLLVKSVNKSDLELECSIIVPVFNQESIIIRNLKSIVQNLNLRSELIIINDASTDSTHKEVCAFIEEEIQATQSKVGRISYYLNQRAQFETKCDDFGFRSASSDFLIEVQADMEILEKGFDSKLKAALYSNKTLLAISGRGTEPLAPIIENYRRGLGTDRSSGRTIFNHTARRAKFQIRNRLSTFFIKKGDELEQKPKINITSSAYGRDHLNNFLDFGEAGRLGNQIELTLDESLLTDRLIYVGQTIMRGPLALQKSKYLAMDGLKIHAFFQAFDDHDFSLRGYLEKKYRVGFVPVNFRSPISDGSTRKVKSIRAEVEILKNIFRIRKERKKSPLYCLGRETLNLPVNEIWTF